MDMTGFRMIPAGQGLMMPASEPWKPVEFGYVLAMWVVMMIGMMTPSVAPMILIYARVGRQAVKDGKPFAATAWFAGGYLLAWLAFSLMATSAQWMLERATLLTPMMASANNLLGGIVLIAAGLYQWTPLKEACLFNCQSPLTFISRNGGFRSDPSGALVLGMRHGIYCVGCCWALMVLLFVGGIMNLSGLPHSQSLFCWRKLCPTARSLPGSLAVFSCWQVDGCSFKMEQPVHWWTSRGSVVCSYRGARCDWKHSCLSTRLPGTMGTDILGLVPFDDCRLLSKLRCLFRRLSSCLAD